MSGVWCGSRLQRLRDLERAVKVQIELEELAERRGRAFQQAKAYPVVEPVKGPPGTVRVPVFMVSPTIIRGWTRDHGYDVAARGPIDAFALGAFVEAHQ